MIDASVPNIARGMFWFNAQFCRISDVETTAIIGKFVYVFQANLSKLLSTCDKSEKPNLEKGDVNSLKAEKSALISVCTFCKTNDFIQGHFNDVVMTAGRMAVVR